MLLVLRKLLGLALALAFTGELRAQEPREPPLDLGALLDEAEAANPEILAAQARLRAAERAPAQAAALPDPTASVSYTNDTLDEPTLGHSIMSNVTLTWSQEVPYPGKRRFAGDVARADVEIARRELEMTRLAVLAEVKRSYAELWAVDRTLGILDDSRGLLESYYGTSRRRYEAGEGLLENVLKAQTEKLRIEAEAASLAQERRSADARLGALLGRFSDVPLGPALDLPLPAAFSGADLEDTALEWSPEVLARRAAARRGEARVDLAERQLKPDFIWSAAYVYREEIDPMAMGLVGLRLPLWRKHKQTQALAQAREELVAARHEAAAAEARHHAEVWDLVARAERAQVQARLYDEGILPLARSVLDAAAAAYAAGQTDFATLIEDLLALVEAQKTYVAERAEEAKALAMLESVTGVTLLVPASDTPAEADHE